MVRTLPVEVSNILLIESGHGDWIINVPREYLRQLPMGVFRKWCVTKQKNIIKLCYYDERRPGSMNFVYLQVIQNNQIEF